MTETTQTKGVRHQFRRNEEVITTYGPVQLDAEGFVTNMSDLRSATGGSVEKSHLLALPNFIDAEVFPGAGQAAADLPGNEPGSKLDNEGDPKAQAAANATGGPGTDRLKPGASTATVDDKKDPTDADYFALIKELIAGGAKTNSEGYIDMEALNHALREKTPTPWPIISGTRRKQITDEGQALIDKAGAQTN